MGKSKRVVITEERVLAILPKNKVSEQRVTAKGAASEFRPTKESYIDFREWWYNQGPTEEPIPKKAGTMIHRRNIPKVIVALVSDMEPGELDEEDIRTIRTQLARIEGGVD